ncbi:hypothetical protein [Rhizobacter sp. Root1221]|uniref:hypothetical protein n=1 Tax=Rhizobacter sp. Root1221 TaxID=1736433 RepID=UPI0006F67349|nr:hypothetical protein [Rhizobacter sp. Root1221]KQV92817.1 hypothetical protein ASC87_27520 [Rhizobacter sp. Root1221]
MNTLLRTRLVAATIALASVSALVTTFSATAAPVDQATATARAEHAERMALIGRTARYDEQAATVSPDAVPSNAAARQQAWEDRAERAGRTVQFGEAAPAAVAPDSAPRNVDEAIANYKERMSRIGRTVQLNELPQVRDEAVRVGIAQGGVRGS